MNDSFSLWDKEIYKLSRIIWSFCHSSGDIKYMKVTKETHKVIIKICEGEKCTCHSKRRVWLDRSYAECTRIFYKHPNCICNNTVISLKTKLQRNKLSVEFTNIFFKYYILSQTTEVYSAKVDVCPQNQTEWQEASRKLNCSDDAKSPVNKYHCLPVHNLTSLLEFCYSGYRPQVVKGK